MTEKKFKGIETYYSIEKKLDKSVFSVCRSAFETNEKNVCIYRFFYKVKCFDCFEHKQYFPLTPAFSFFSVEQEVVQKCLISPFIRYHAQNIAGDLEILCKLKNRTNYSYHSRQEILYQLKNTGLNIAQ
jgi:hypothetical protein